MQLYANVPGSRTCGPGQVQHVIWLVRKIGQLRHGCLHLIRHFVLGDAGADFRVAGLLKFYFV